MLLLLLQLPLPASGGGGGGGAGAAAAAAAAAAAGSSWRLLNRLLPHSPSMRFLGKDESFTQNVLTILPLYSIWIRLHDNE